MKTDEYIQALKAHDWYYQFSDDHSMWTAGNEQAKKLREAQRRLDPQGELWNQHCPKGCEIAVR